MKRSTYPILTCAQHPETVADRIERVANVVGREATRAR
jgi:hypothetical protein